MLTAGQYSNKESRLQPADRLRIRELLVILDIYSIDAQGVIRRKETIFPKWAWLRKNR